jgi:uncharacterized membrane protein YphA (DoxX/SURF4 family)
VLILVSVAILAIRIALAGIFLIAGGFKLLHGNQFQVSLKELGIPRPIAKSAYRVLPVLEILLGFALLTTRWRPYPEVVAALTLLCFAAILSWSTHRGSREAPCGCFPWSNDSSVPWRSVYRNIMLATAAVIAGAPAETRRSDVAMSTMLVLATLAMWLVLRMVRTLAAPAQTPPSTHLRRSISRPQRKVQVES